MVDIAKYEKRLKKRQEELRGRLEEVGEVLARPHDKDWEEDAVEHEQDEVLEDIEEMSMKELRAVEAALGRIKIRTYGICVSCGADISEDRLDLIPHTPFCKDCAPGRETV